MKKIWPYIASLLSAGWLVPAFLVGTSFVAYLKTELEPRISGQPFNHSFPILDSCLFWFAVAVVWLGTVTVCWSIYILKRKD